MASQGTSWRAPQVHQLSSPAKGEVPAKATWPFVLVVVVVVVVVAAVVVVAIAVVVVFVVFVVPAAVDVCCL